ncbi:DinB family protein [Halobacillus sp. ACCC02827]|uniref:DinB family protein n=1 Tax=Bacillaceae TaxID=186817 RepID=UPI0002A4E1B5|nr:MULTISPECIES: DinB family protein [Bacillaceae]ELK46426.1 hypothetical protein D479_10641 [Halobacillus sp. BAB-2008]QHT45714.1 DinB family protein [Bacillus sp. SB49]WJE16512.1 DinB family protein [Halobacillus sp. ACCC02827]
MYGLDEKREQLLEYVREIPASKHTVKPAENRWSIMEVLEHLYLIEQFVIHQVNRSLKQGDQQQVTEKPVHKVTNRSYTLEAPESVRPKGIFHNLKEAEDGLKKSREATLFLIHNKEKETLQNRAFPHPALGDMNLEQWVEFIGWHELRHLDQIKEINQSLNT